MSFLISVIIPCYNAGKWVRKAVRSIELQTYSTLEIIAIDDGSEDETYSILRAAARRDKRIRIIRLPQNAGIVAALNEGLSQAKGEYIARMDADDIAYPDRLERQISYMLARKLDLCGSWVVEFAEGIPRTVKLPVEPAAVNVHLLFQNVICHPSIIARREVFETYQYRISYECAEDYDVFARASLRFRLGNCPEPLLRYRQSPGQITSARRLVMQSVCDRVRQNLLQDRGIPFTEKELRIHNSIRAHESIRSFELLYAAERWLLKLHKEYDDNQAKCAVASQWARACIRAAPLGIKAWQCYRRSELRRHYNPKLFESLDVLVLTALRLRHEGATFGWLKRMGLSS